MGHLAGSKQFNGRLYTFNEYSQLLRLLGFVQGLSDGSWAGPLAGDVPVAQVLLCQIKPFNILCILSDPEDSADCLNNLP